MASFPPNKIDDPVYAELNRLFRLYRLSNLNVRYYGRRAERYEGFGWWLNLTAGSASAVALGTLLIFDNPGHAETARLTAATLAGLAAFLTALAPLLGWETKAKTFCNLHFAYSQLFGEIEALIARIRREDQVTAAHIGASDVLHEQFIRIESLDEMQPDEELIQELNRKVEQAIPDNYIWTSF